MENGYEFDTESLPGAVASHGREGEREKERRGREREKGGKKGAFSYIPCTSPLSIHTVHTNIHNLHIAFCATFILNQSPSPVLSPPQKKTSSHPPSSSSHLLHPRPLRAQAARAINRGSIGWHGWSGRPATCFHWRVPGSRGRV
jgi:hypothetical protein